MARRSKGRTTGKTVHQQAEADLTAYAMSLPETDIAPGWGTTRYLRVRGKGFCVFGEKDEPADALTMIVKLPVAAEMVGDLYFVREAKGWFKQHNWVIAHFGPEDDVRAEMGTLRGWILQSYMAMAPKKLARQVDPRGAD
jgi:hypothetical protein